MSSHEDGLVYDERIMPYMQLNRKSCMLISHPNLDVKYAYNNWKSDYAIHQFALKQISTSKKDARTAKELFKYIENELSIDINKELFQELLNNIMVYSKYLAGYVKACKQYLNSLLRVHVEFLPLIYASPYKPDYLQPAINPYNY